MKKCFLFAVGVFIYLLPCSAQTPYNPGVPDSLYPVTNFVDEWVQVGGYTPFRSPAYVSNLAKANGKYYLGGYFTDMVDNNGSALIVDTATNTIINNAKWRIKGVVYAAVPDGLGGFYIAGNFTQIGDSARKNIAQIKSTGQPTAWQASTDSTVKVLVKRNDTLFIGGPFRKFNGETRYGFAMYNVATATSYTLPSFYILDAVHTFILQNDTLIYGGYNFCLGTTPCNLRKYNIKTRTPINWNVTSPDYGYIKYIALSPDSSVLIYGGEYNGEFIKGVNNSWGTVLYQIDLSSYWPSGYHSALLKGLKTVGDKVYAGGIFAHALWHDDVFFKKGLFAFDARTGYIYPEDPGLDGNVYFLEANKSQLIISGKFKTAKGVPRNQFAVVDTGTFNVAPWQLSPSDYLTALAFSNGKAFIAGKFRGLGANTRKGLAVIDSVTHTLGAFAPLTSLTKAGKKIEIRGDTVFTLTNMDYSCPITTATAFKLYSLSTGATYGNGAPAVNIESFGIDSNYIYISTNNNFRRYSLPGVQWQTTWPGVTGHAVEDFVISGDKIYAVGTNCTRAYFDVINKHTGVVLQSYSYEDTSRISYKRFERALLTGNRLYVQGKFMTLNGKPRKSFACININTGELTDWHTDFPTVTYNTSYSSVSFGTTSPLKLYDGKIWFGASKQVLSDGSIFSGFAAIDTVTGNIVAQPLQIGSRDPDSDNSIDGPVYDFNTNSTVYDFNLSGTELSIAGSFDSLNQRAVHGFAVFHLNGVDTKEVCNNGSTSFKCYANSNAYQWQMDSGSGFANINNNSYFTGTNTNTLQVQGVPTTWYGYKFRCYANGVYSDAYSLKFTATWTGAVSTAWEEPGNWNCGYVPDVNTDVKIPVGTVLINSNNTIRSIALGGNVSFTVNPGYSFIILH